MFDIKLETQLPVYLEDPCAFTRPVSVTITGFADDGEYVVGRMMGDFLHLSKAKEVGHRLVDVFDCDVWEYVFADLIDRRGEWRKELNLDDLVFELVVFYRIVLAPCTASVRREILQSVFDFFSCYTLIGLWNITNEVEQAEMIDLGFAKLSKSKMVLRHNARLCKFARERNPFGVPCIEPTEADEAWVEERYDEFE